MLLSDAIDRYLADRTAKGYAKGTIRSYGGTLKQFLADVGNIQVSSLQPRHLDIFWARHPEWSAGNFNKHRGNLAAFFSWCQARGHLPRTADPMEGLRKRKVVPRDRIIIPQEDWDTVLNAAEDPRDRAIVALGLYLFTRVSETTALRWADLNFQTKEVSVFRTKTQTIDQLPMCEELEYEMKRWRLAFAENYGELPKPGWFITPPYTAPRFRGRVGKTPIFQGNVVLQPTKQLKAAAHRVKVVLDAAGYEDLSWEGGHTLRRSGATALYNELSGRGHDKAIRLCQAMLGHASIQTTEIYLRLDLDRKARNDLLSGRKMFQPKTGARVVQIDGAASG